MFFKDSTFGWIFNYLRRFDSMGLDIVFLIFAIWYGYKGYNKGMVKVLFSFVAFSVATLGALKLSGKIGAFVFEKSGTLGAWVPLLSFLLVFVGILLLAFFVSKTVDKTLKTVKLGGLNRLAGASLYIVLVMFLFSTLVWLTDKVHLLSADFKSGSLVYNYLAPIAPKAFEYLGYVAPFVKNAYAELNQLLDQINNRL